MEIGKITHSEIDHHIYVKNLFLAAQGSEVSLDNLVGIKAENSIHIISITWLITVFLSGSNDAIMDYAFETNVELKSVVDYDTDLKELKGIVSVSCTAFMEKIEEMEGTMPLIQPKFEEIAIRILELLTDISLY